MAQTMEGTMRRQYSLILTVTGFLLFLLVSCKSTLTVDQPVDQRKFELLYRSAKSIEAATSVGLSLSELTKLVQSMKTEASIARDKANNEAENLLVNRFQDVLDSYEFSADAWRLKIGFNEHAEELETSRLQLRIAELKLESAKAMDQYDMQRRRIRDAYEDGFYSLNFYVDESKKLNKQKHDFMVHQINKEADINSEIDNVKEKISRSSIHSIVAGDNRAEDFKLEAQTDIPQVIWAAAQKRLDRAVRLYSSQPDHENARKLSIKFLRQGLIFAKMSPAERSQKAEEFLNRNDISFRWCKEIKEALARIPDTDPMHRRAQEYVKKLEKHGNELMYAQREPIG